jgi:hypothetical protein
VGPLPVHLPFFILFAIFGVFTLAYTFWVSLHDWSLLGGMNAFVGIDNYVRLLDDPRFFKATVNTFSILLLSTVPQMILALILAEVLNDRLLRASHLFRSGLLVPNITSVVAIAIVFQSLFARQNGLINAIIQLLGFEPINWHAGRLTSHIAIASMVNWQFTGFNTLIFLAALQAIPLALLRGGADRRRQPDPALLQDLAAAAAARDPVRGGALRDRPAAAVRAAAAVRRRCWQHEWRQRQPVPDDPAVPVQPGVPAAVPVRLLGRDRVDAGAHVRGRRSARVRRQRAARPA